MNYKRIVGIAMLIIGAAAIIYSIHSMNRISEAKSEVHSLTSPFSGSSAGRTVGGMMGSEASQYDTKVMLLLIGGIILAVGGGSLALFCQKGRRR
jgi:hypothetical protein